MRALLQIVSMGGIFYSAMCSEKTARAAIHPQGGAITKDQFVSAAVERLCKQTDRDEGDAEATSMAHLSKALLGTAKK